MLTEAFQCADYLRHLLNPKLRAKTLKRVVSFLEGQRQLTPFDAIAFRGMSGALIGTAVADRLEVGLIAVRKPNDGCHSCRTVEGSMAENYVIIDDLISSGDTIATIIEDIRGNHNRCAKCVGIYLYHSYISVNDYHTRFSDVFDAPVFQNSSEKVKEGANYPTPYWLHTPIEMAKAKGMLDEVLEEIF